MFKSVTILFVGFVLFSLGQLFAQTPDTVDVPNIVDGSPINALQKFIYGDTTDTGDRNNINRTYRLERGKIYYVDGKTFFDFPIRMIANDEPSDVQPPVIAPWPLDDGSISRITFYCYEDSYFKNLYFLAYAPTGQRNGWDRPLILGGESTMRVEGCIVDGYTGAGIANIGENTSLFIKDCIWRNNNMWQFGGQTFFNYGSAMDTISIINTTFFNGASYFLCTAQELTNYIRFEHNTLFNNNTNPFYVRNMTDGIVQNNIFYNAASVGETETERNDDWYDWDGERMAIFSIDTLGTEHGITEADRKIDLLNNAYFWNSKITDYLASNDTVDAPVWLNDRTQAMFDDDVNYPYLIEENNVEADPGFNEDVLKYVDSLLAFVVALRSGGDNGFSYATTPFPGVWPIPENLAYTNTELQTASTLGYPLGDLNWFPDKKVEWEEEVTAIRDEHDANIVTDFSLSQNYPNPFNPVTTIKYTLPANKNTFSDTKLVVYDVLGREITTLVNKPQKAGEYKVTFDARNIASGVYFYKLQSGDFAATKKLIILK